MSSRFTAFFGHSVPVIFEDAPILERKRGWGGKKIGIYRNFSCLLSLRDYTGEGEVK